VLWRWYRSALEAGAGGATLPVRDASERDDGTLSRSDFRWDRRRGLYICPNGKVLRTTGKVHEGKRFAISHPSTIAMSVPSRCCVVLIVRRDKFPVMFMNMPATRPAG
jgi:hypothetical protein